MTPRAHCLALVACLALPGIARAASCSVTVVGVAFADYDVFKKGATNTTGKVKVHCGASLSYTIALSAGTGTFASRLMTSGGYDLQYNLFTDSQRVTVWGDGTSGSVTVSATDTGATYTVYARIPARQNVPVGSYSDTVTVTVTY
jgi:spore coat protein U domain-containing protein, fimbrial subunit CupE1/2/3/6